MGTFAEPIAVLHAYHVMGIAALHPPYGLSPHLAAAEITPIVM